MREIKYRAWDKKNKRMGEVIRISYEEETAVLKYKIYDPFPGKYIEIEVEKNFKDIDLLPYTGFNDEDGKEIYKGDVCICIQTVSALNKNSFSHFHGVIDDILPMIKHKHPQSYSLKIIGNIYENPELLEVKE